MLNVFLILGAFVFILFAMFLHYYLSTRHYMCGYLKGYEQGKQMGFTQAQKHQRLDEFAAANEKS